MTKAELIQENKELRAKATRKIRKMPASMWALKDPPTVESVPIERLKAILESERRGQIEANGWDDEAKHAVDALEIIWWRVNNYDI